MFRILLFLSLISSLQVLADQQTTEVLLKNEPSIKVNSLDIFTLNGMRQAITKELEDKKLNSEELWQKLDAKNMNNIEEQDFFKPYFSAASLSIPEPQVLDNEEKIKADIFSRAIFIYEIDSKKVKNLYDVHVTNLPDLALKTFYIFPDISIDSVMTWEDVGVTKKENFSGVIAESWKKWAESQFKNYPNIVILEKDFVIKSETTNSESVILKWISSLKKTEVFQDRKSARFEINGQFVLNNAKSGETLVGFDFPSQKREINISKPKDLSSTLASLIYNLLNSQTSRISSALELNKASSTLITTEMTVTGRHGLLDITQVNSMLIERFKEVALSSELKSYSSESSVITMKSTATLNSLTVLLARDGGRFTLNEQKILLFNPTNRSFAILPK